MALDAAGEEKGFIQRLAGCANVSTGRWHVAKRLAYIVVLGIALLIFYLLRSLGEALDMLTP